MSIAVMNLVWSKSRAKGSSLLLMLALADNADDKGFCWPHVKTLSKKARMTPRNVQLARGTLEEMSELEVKVGEGRGGGNLYRIRLEILGAYDDADPEEGDEKISPPPTKRFQGGGEAAFTGGVNGASPPSEPSGEPPSILSEEDKIVPPEELFERCAKAFNNTPQEARLLQGTENARTLIALNITHGLLRRLEKLWAITNGKEYKGRKVFHSTKLFKFCQEPTGDIGTARDLFPASKVAATAQPLTLAPAHSTSDAELDAAHEARYREKVRIGFVPGVEKDLADAVGLSIPARPGKTAPEASQAALPLS